MSEIKGVENIEITSLDIRYESYRMRYKGVEERLLASILENGIRDPLQGVSTNGGRILLDGFKRYRCAKHLSIGIVPYRSLGSDEAMGIMELIRISNSGSLSILEQAKLIDELARVYKMTVSEIAGLLERSKGWVGMRIGMIREMSEYLTMKIFSGEFPAYSYMYTLRSFIRMNGIKREEIDEFVGNVSGLNLSIREIELLAYGYFKGSEGFREQIRSGNISWSLSRIREARANTTDCTEIERRMLKDIEIIQRYMQRVRYKANDRRYKSSSFFAQANILTGVIIRDFEGFSRAIRELHDRSGETQSNILPS